MNDEPEVAKDDGLTFVWTVSELRQYRQLVARQRQEQVKRSANGRSQR